MIKHPTPDLTDNGSVAIQLTAVSKQFRQRPVLHNVNLTVPTGAMIGISGANGSGKSILLRIISGLVLPDQGTVRVFDQQIGRKQQFPDQLGALIDGPGFAAELNGRQNLALLASIRNRITAVQIDQALQSVGLDPSDGRAVKTYSTGMRQRLGIAQAIMEQPRLLLLDEPTSALDADGVHTIHTLLRTLQAQGCTIVIVSHHKTECETLCQTIYQLQDGRLQAGAAPLR